MKVKVRVPKNIYFDREQQLTFTGEGVIETKVTSTVRALLASGELIEVTEETPKKPVEAKVIKTGKATSETKTTEEA